MSTGTKKTWEWALAVLFLVLNLVVILPMIAMGKTDAVGYVGVIAAIDLVVLAVIVAATDPVTGKMFSSIKAKWYAVGVTTGLMLLVGLAMEFLGYSDESALVMSISLVEGALLAGLAALVDPGTRTVFTKELRGFVISPVAYVMAFVFLIICGYFFQESMSGLSRYTSQYPMLVQQAQQRAEYGAPMPTLPNVDEFVVKRTFGIMSFLLIFIVPILTMRTYSEEYRNGTIELLWTSPVGSGATLAGKYISTVTLYSAIILLSLVYIAVGTVFTQAGAGPDAGLVFSSFLGMVFLGAAFISVGIFASSVTENQIVAAVISFSILLFFLMIGFASDFVGNYKALQFLQYLSISGHMDQFLRGVISARDTLYYVSFIGFMMFLTYLVIESRRWRT